MLSLSLYSEYSGEVSKPQRGKMRAFVSRTTHAAGLFHYHAQLGHDHKQDTSRNLQ